MFKFIIGILAMVLLLIGSLTSKVNVHDNISQYNDFIGINAKEEYINNDYLPDGSDATNDNEYQKKC